MAVAPIPETFNEVCHNYSAAILSIIRRYNRDKVMEKDIQQEVFLKMWRYWPSYERKKGSYFSWVRVITVNICIDHVRKIHGMNAVIRPVGGSDDVANLSGGNESGLYRYELIRMADQLSPCQRAVIHLIYFKGLTQDETSRLLNVPLGTIKSRQRTALLCLRKMSRDIF